MLVLTRTVDQKILIGNNREITVKILRVHGGQVRIGVKTPKGWKVQREESIGILERNQLRYLEQCEEQLF